jgi:hypothetical protein
MGYSQGADDLGYSFCLGHHGRSRILVAVDWMGMLGMGPAAGMVSAGEL